MRNERFIETLLAAIGTRIGKPRGWERVVRFLVPPERCGDFPAVVVRTRLGGLFLAEPNTPLGWHVRFCGGYELPLQEYFASVVRAGDVVLDVGANVGWHSIAFGRLVGPSGAVVAFEPNPSVRQRLLFNRALNRLSWLRVMEAALSDRAGDVVFHGPAAEDATSGDGHIIANPDSAGQDAVRVAAKRLDDLWADLGLSRLDFIKIDIEGWEWNALEGGRRVIAEYRPTIVFEHNAEFVGRGGGSTERLRAFFEELGYRILSFGRSGPAPVVHSWPPSANLLAVPC